MLLPIDELNAYNFEKSAVFYKKYFEINALSEKQRKDRVDFAMEFEDSIISFLLLIALIIEGKSTVEVSKATKVLSDNYKGLISSVSYADDTLVRYTLQFADNITNTTLDRYKNKYTFSQARVQEIVANEAQGIFNYLDYKNAILDGKTHKTWKTIMDGRERPTHMDVNGTTIPIFDYFYVGNAKMRYAHDIEMASEHPEELINCRCSTIYT